MGNRKNGSDSGNGGKVRLYTIQDEEFWNTLQENGFIAGSKKHSTIGYRESYNLMGRYMIERGITPASPDDDIIFAWRKWNGKDKPDLRFSGHKKRGTPCVRLRIEVDPSRILVSDILLWTNVINHWPICKSEEEEAKFNDSKYLNAHRAETYRRAFDYEDEGLLEFQGIKKENQGLQATMWYIRLEDVKEVQHFIAR